MKIEKLIFALFSYLVFTSYAWAEVKIEEREYFLRPAIVLTGGAAFVSGLDSSSDFPIGLSQYDYDGHHDDSTRGVWGGFVGAEFPIHEDWTMQTGLVYYQVSNLPVDGTLTQGFDAPSSDQFKFKYKIVSRQLLLETKLLTEWEERYHPYVSVGLGAAFNKAQAYEAEAESCQCTFTPIYKDHTKTSFSYSLGLGLDYDITSNFRFGLGYRFTDLGDAQLGHGELVGTEIPGKLKHSHLYAQEIIAQLTYFMR